MNCQRGGWKNFRTCANDDVSCRELLGRIPCGLEMVGTAPALSVTAGSALAVDSDVLDIFIAPKIVAAPSAKTKIEIRIFLTVLLIFELLNEIKFATAKLALISIHLKL